MIRILLYYCLLLIAIGCSNKLMAQRFTPDIIVALDGSGDFTKIQAAIDAAPDNSSTKTVIYIKRGLYNTEKLIVPANKTNLIFIGESRDETIISYHIYDCSNGKCPATDAARWTGENIITSATLTILGNGFQAENLTIQNTAGPVGQAQAITVRADKVIFRNCNLTGYQDTIYFWSQGNRAYFENCLILGRTDYIYGGGTVFFQACEIRSWGGGWITAPSTSLDQPYGFVFNKCNLTYALNSPRAGDDGALVAFGRPWQNYPKVAWLYCNITEKINPLGWPDKWNMAYADTSPDLHLYEYGNTGAGANQSGRANWAGIRALTAAEAANYTVQKVLGGNDNWDPSAEAPAAVTYNWIGNGDWLNANNWDPTGIPGAGEAAYVDGAKTITANGGHFSADLTLTNGAALAITAPSEVTYLAVGNAKIQGVGNVSLTGRVRTKDSLEISTTDTFQLATEISGVHAIQKTGIGLVEIMNENPGFTGFWTISEGSLQASVAHALGKARQIIIKNQGNLIIDNSDAYFIETPLFTQSDAHLILNTDIILSEFYINGMLQPVGEYSAATHPDLISGTGKIIIGRPQIFNFIGGANGNWDNPAHFSPALLPEAGETVLTSREMETTAFVFPADIVVKPGGRMRLRGEHSATGTIFMESGTSFAYATSGTGFKLDAPIVVLADIQLIMNSRAVPEHAMRLGGSISGSAKIIAFNQRADTENTGIVILSGDNSSFTGTWDLTLPSANPNAVTVIQGKSANAFGQGTIEVGDKNRVALSHEKCAGEVLRVNLSGQGRIRLDTIIKVNQAIVNNVIFSDGNYNRNTHPDIFTGSGNLIVGGTTGISESYTISQVYAAHNRLYIKGLDSDITLYNINGQPIIINSKAKEIALNALPPGVYFVRFQVDQQQGICKIIVQ